VISSLNQPEFRLFVQVADEWVGKSSLLDFFIVALFVGV
jgi:hypothetical protein